MGPEVDRVGCDEVVPRRVDVVIVGGSHAMKNWDSAVVTCYMSPSGALRC